MRSTLALLLAASLSAAAQPTEAELLTQAATAEAVAAAFEQQAKAWDRALEVAREQARDAANGKRHDDSRVWAKAGDTWQSARGQLLQRAEAEREKAADLRRRAERLAAKVKPAP